MNRNQIKATDCAPMRDRPADDARDASVTMTPPSVVVVVVVVARARVPSTTRVALSRATTVIQRGVANVHSRVMHRQCVPYDHPRVSTHHESPVWGCVLSHHSDGITTRES